MSRYSNFNKEIKIAACQAYETGKGSYQSIANGIGADRQSVCEWYSAYMHHGSEAFNSSNRNASYSVEYKENIVDKYLSGVYSTMELSGKYNISHSMVKRWINRYNNGIAFKDYNPKGEVYTMKSRKTTVEERLEIVKWVIKNDMNYKDAADKYAVRYAAIYQWVQKYLEDGKDELQYKKRGPKPKVKIDESTLSNIEKLKLELEREKALRKRAEFRLEVLKKKEDFEEKLRFRK